MLGIMKTVNIYFFNDLSDKAKQKAIEQNRDINIFHDWYEIVYEDVSNIAEILGIDIENIYFSGFYSQGDGACFEGTYSYNKGAHKKIKEYAPNDETLHKIATQLWDLQSENFYRLSATIKHSGHYYHKYCTDIDVYNENDSMYHADEETAEFVRERLRDFMQWIYNSLEKEYEHLTSDEAVAETLAINEYEFKENGERF